MGKLPIFSSLKRIALEGRVPGQLVIQMTDKCNARCPQCEMRVTNRYDRSEMTTDEIKRNIDAAAEKGIQVISFTGGEPMLQFDQLIELMHHAGKAGLRLIRTGTNGYLFKNPDGPNWEGRIRQMAERMAETKVRNFWISIDSCVPEVHERMRGFPKLIEGIERALPIFHEAGIYPSANLGVNRNVGGSATWDLYPEQFAKESEYLDAFYLAVRKSMQNFYRFVGDLGFTIVNCCYPMSIDSDEQARGLQAVYGATATDRIIRFTRPERARLFKALFEVVPEFRSQLRIFSPRASLYTLYNEYAGLKQNDAYACRGGIDFFFVNSVDGNTYPCGYRGSDNFGKFYELDLGKVNKSAACTDCDWECFRDPSELIGPVLELFTQPGKLMKRFMSDPAYARLWWEDVKYYRACNFFDGRRPLEPRRLRDFSAEYPVVLEEPAPLAA